MKRTREEEKEEEPNSQTTIHVLTRDIWRVICEFLEFDDICTLKIICRDMETKVHPIVIEKSCLDIDTYTGDDCVFDHIPKRLIGCTAIMSRSNIRAEKFSRVCSGNITHLQWDGPLAVSPHVYFPFLRELYLDNSHLDDFDSGSEDEYHVFIFPEMPHLEVLSINGYMKGYLHLARLPNLRSLAIEGCVGYTDVEFDFSCVPKLEHFSMVMDGDDYPQRLDLNLVPLLKTLRLDISYPHDVDISGLAHLRSFAIAGSMTHANDGVLVPPDFSVILREDQIGIVIEEECEGTRLVIKK